MHTQRIIIIEHRYLLRAGLEYFVTEIPGMEVVKLFDGNEKKLLDKVKASRPDIIVINPKSVGDVLMHFLNNLDNNIKTIALISGKTDGRILSHFRYFIHQTDEKQELQKILFKDIDKSENNSETKNRLSNRETTVLKYLVKGYTNREIADELFLSIHTVMTHRKNITRKLGIKTVSGLTVYALMNKLVTLPEAGR